MSCKSNFVVYKINEFLLFNECPLLLCMVHGWVSCSGEKKFSSEEFMAVESGFPLLLSPLSNWPSVVQYNYEGTAENLCKEILHIYYIFPFLISSPGGDKDSSLFIIFPLLVEIPRLLVFLLCKGWFLVCSFSSLITWLEEVKRGKEEK